jgi:hypothetical protein
LEEYVLIEQKRPEVVIQRRSDQWVPEVLTSLEEVAEFRSIDLSLELKQICEGLFSASKGASGPGSGRASQAVRHRSAFA